MKFKVVHKPAGERLRGHVRALRARDGLFFSILVLFLQGDGGAELSGKTFPLGTTVPSFYDFTTFFPSSSCNRQRLCLEKRDTCLTVGMCPRDSFS